MQTIGQQYLDLGFSIIPLGEIKRKPEGTGKDISYPIAWKQYQTRRPTTEVVQSWHWSNLGIITGEISNLVVVDTDIYKQGYDDSFFKSFNIPVTPVQETAGGGRQYFFKHPKGIKISNAVCIGNKD